MKKFALVVAAAATFAAAAPVVAQEAPADPFVSTSLPTEALTGLAVVGGLALIIAIAAAGDNSDGS